MKLSATNPLVIENKLNGLLSVHQESFLRSPFPRWILLWTSPDSDLREEKSWRWWRIKWDKATQPKQFPSRVLKYFFSMHFRSENRIYRRETSEHVVCAGGQAGSIWWRDYLPPKAHAFSINVTGGRDKEYVWLRPIEASLIFMGKCRSTKLKNLIKKVNEWKGLSLTWAWLCVERGRRRVERTGCHAGERGNLVLGLRR